MATRNKAPRPSRVVPKLSAGASKMLHPADALAPKARDIDEMLASMPFNASKRLEYGHASALNPPVGSQSTVGSATLLASTASEKTSNEKTGRSAVAGANPVTAAMDRVRVDAGGQVLTTNQGVPVSDNQHSLKAGLRGPALLEDFVLREKITHFDHERIPERIVHARGSATHGFFFGGVFRWLHDQGRKTVHHTLQRIQIRRPRKSRVKTVPQQLINLHVN